MRAADTNVVVRLVTRDDLAQMVRAEAFVQRGVWLSHVVLAEVAWVLSSSYKFSAAAIADAVDLILRNPGVAVEDLELVRAALETFREKPATSFADCLILEIARKAGHLPLGTFDRPLGKLDGAELI